LLVHLSPAPRLITGPAANYAGNITITVAHSTGMVGIGILSDGVTPVTLNALAATARILASATVFTSAAGLHPGF
jgi:hypothetical protein